MDVLQLPVILVVKAPNQRVDDHVVKCWLGWTIGKLKQHLSSSYPNKPKETQQRLIYSGKLLQDHHTLKDILKHTYEATETMHTVHLLCSATMLADINTETNAEKKPKSTETTPVPSQVKPSVSNAETSDNEGLRRRQNITPVTNNVSDLSSNFGSMPNIPASQYYQSIPGYSSVNQWNGAMNPSMMHPQYSSNQMMWYQQQMYAYQMSQYMQYMQQAYPGTMPTAPAFVNAPVSQAPAQAQAQNVVNNPPVQQQNQNNQQMVMNAAGGQAVFEDEEEVNRDWLDWSYILCRFGMLVAIVYFYSTLGRFFMVFCFFFVVYLYQSGWFRLNRRQPAPVQQVA